ncbi:MAG TPA: FAD-dependent oxidoreductase [Steroidobacteraceae bacterium]|nr:FAD-dependent oxidoreductase [Steroidobacteraceae bacterium]
MNDYDLIIIGGGGAGLAAGIMAREAGASCIILEADKKLGGATALSAAVMYAAGTSVQRAAGIRGDTPEAMYHYIMTLAGWEANPRIVRILCEQSGPGLEWLISLGVEFPPQYLVCSGVDDVPRGHPSLGAGGTVAERLINAAGARGVEHALDTRVDALLAEKGRVVGVRCGATELRGGAVLIATGGFGNSPEMIERLFPTAARNGGDWTYAVHYAAPFILGDGIKLGESVGAALVGRDTGLLLPTSGLGRFVEAFLPPWIMLVNIAGRRFMDEAAPYAVSGYIINAQPQQRCYALFDSVALEEGSQDMRFADPYHSGAAMPTWEYNLLKRSIESGKVVQGASVSRLANLIGVNPTALEASVEQYNADCDRGLDSQFFKETERFFPLRTPPFYAREVRASVIGQTGAGLDINERAQVLDGRGHAIPGLYAAGEVLGCSCGRRYSGGGMGICNAIVFGRIAGTAAAAEALEQRRAA